MKTLPAVNWASCLLGFCLDLYKVAFWPLVASRTPATPMRLTEFFRRTYLTEGLSDLLGRAVRRLSGDDNAPPVINLQTNFGGQDLQRRPRYGTSLRDYPSGYKRLRICSSTTRL